MLNLIIAAALSFSALNFNAFELPMQMGVALAVLAACYVWGGLKRAKEPMAAQILLGMASLFLLFIGVYMMKLHGIEEPVLVVGYVFITSLIWMITGLLARLALFQLCGWVSLVFFVTVGCFIISLMRSTGLRWKLAGCRLGYCFAGCPG